jgi:uncharacterized membrane protein YbaN (DUF454 family)
LRLDVLQARLDVGCVPGDIVASRRQEGDRVAIESPVNPPDRITEDEPQVMSSRVGRVAYAAFGFLFLGLGIAGYVLPVLPGTVFILVSVWFFFKSNARMYRWVLNHPRFGPTVRAYRAGHGIPRRIKTWAISLMAVSIAFSVLFAMESTTPRLVLIGAGVFGAVFILTRPTTERVLAGA